MPRVRSRPCEPAGSPYPFPQFPARLSHASSFTQPPAIGYRARTPRRCFPMGSSEAAFCGVLQSRRGDASRWARLRRLSTGFSNAAAAVLPDGLVRGGFLRGFATAALRAAPPFPFVLLSPAAWPYFFLYHPLGQRCRTPLFLHPFVPLGGRDSAAFFAACTGGGVVRSLFALSAARPALHLFFCTPPPATGCRAGSPRRCFPMGSSEAAFCGVFQRRRCAQRRRSLLSFSPPPPGERMPRVRSRPCEPAGSPFPFPHFPTARSYFFLYPAVLPAIPRATFPASFCPAGRQGQRRVLYHLHGRRSSALPFRPIGGAPGTAPLFLHPAARHRMPRTVAPSIQTAKTTPLPFPMLPGDGRAHANRRAVPSISTLFRAHPALPGGGHARLIPPAPARGCSCSRLLPPHLSFDFRPALPSAQPTPVRASLPRRFLRFRAALFPAAALGSALPCSPPPRAVSGPVPARADASRRSFAFPLARRAPFLPCAPCTPGLCASRRGGGSCKASCCALLHARPCSCAGGRVAPFFRLSPRAPRAFLALRPLCARPVRIASR